MKGCRGWGFRDLFQGFANDLEGFDTDSLLILNEQYNVES